MCWSCASSLLHHEARNKQCKNLFGWLRTPDSYRTKTSVQNKTPQRLKCFRFWIRQLFLSRRIRCFISDSYWKARLGSIKCSPIHRLFQHLLWNTLATVFLCGIFSIL